MMSEPAAVPDAEPSGPPNRQALDHLERFGVVVDREARVVDAGDVLTAAGPLAGVDLAIRLVERYQGAEAAERAAERLDHVRRGPLVVAEAPVGGDSVGG